MTVFDFPPQALAETDCFSVPSRDGAEELLIIPPRALPDTAVSQATWVYFHAPQMPLERLPITPRTLVPEYLAARFAENPVMISSQLCGGTLRERLADALARFGERVWLLCEPLCARLPLPCPDAREERVSQAEIQAFFAEHPALYTPEFCCEYAVDTERSQLYLRDTAQTINQKLALADSLGIPHALCLPQT